METYKLYRVYQKNFAKRVIDYGLTLEEAQAHCNNPETSSTTCTTSAGRKRTAKMGAWFDCYESE